MDIHHHTHTPRKKWLHYFYEFLMLFLAVFCGFLAENQREHYIEAQRAKEYANGLFKDIENDTADIHKGIRHIKFYVSVIDSIFSITKENYERTKVPGTFYYYSRLASNIYPVDWSRSTMNQLIQSGNLRYFRNKELVDKINRYYALQSNIDGHSETDAEQRNIIRSLRNKMLDNRYFSCFVLKLMIDDAVDDKPLAPEVDSLIRIMLPLRKDGEQYLHEYLNHLGERSLRLKGNFDKKFAAAAGLAEEIMNMLREEYHL